MVKERIHTEEQYRCALARFLKLCDAKKDTPEYQEFLWLMECMEQYENENC